MPMAHVLMMVLTGGQHKACIKGWKMQDIFITAGAGRCPKERRKNSVRMEMKSLYDTKCCEKIRMRKKEGQIDKQTEEEEEEEDTIKKQGGPQPCSAMVSFSFFFGWNWNFPFFFKDGMEAVDEMGNRTS
ncbi:hypothetical protein Dimus_003079 [Dionaea muscipula]